MSSFLTRASIAALFACIVAAAPVRAQCDGCIADASPAFVDSGGVISCAGVVQLRMTITPSDGQCIVDEYGYCQQIDDCDFDVLVEYRARSCTGGKATFGKTGCGTIFMFLVEYPMSSPAWSTVTSGNVSRNCDDFCVLTFFGQCKDCTTGSAQVSSTLSCSPCETD